MKKLVIFLLSFSALNLYAQNYVSKVWSPDQGDGTYKNPILFADYSDPDACRAGDDYYLTASSFNCVPGLPILHSKDLVNWKLINHALPELKMEGLEPADIYDKPLHGRGVFAPSISYHNGEFYIYWGDPDYGIYMVKTKNPAGEWSKPILVKPGKGMIDPSPLFDDDGKAYLVHAWAASRLKVNSILSVVEMSADGTKVIGKEVLVFDGAANRNRIIEGPKFSKRNGYYYILAPAGGVATGWQLALRSKSVYGPYEHKVVLEQGTSQINGPHQGALLTTKANESWFMHFQDMDAYGRVTHLQPVQWINDWPEMGVEKHGKREPVLTYRKPNVGAVYPVENPIESDEFDRLTLGLQWQWPATQKDPWAMPTNAGYLRLYAIPTPGGYANLWDVPNLLLQKFPAKKFTATTKLTLTSQGGQEKAGLLVMGQDYSYLSINHTESGYTIAHVICQDAKRKTEETVTGTVEVKDNTVYLRVVVAEDGFCQFSFSTDGNTYQPIGNKFKAKVGEWIGAKVGIFALKQSDKGNLGYADFDWFRVE